jgi:Fur family zinc uptake transcriptional regulator
MNSFVACSHPDHHHHDHGVTAFAICEDCGQVTEMHDAGIEERLSVLAGREHFKTEKTTIEIRGHCQNCTSG